MDVPFWDDSDVTESDALGSFPLGYDGDLYSTYPWDVVTFNGSVKTPGIAEVTATPSRAVDKRKPQAGDGASVTLHGYNPAQIELRIRVWTPPQFAVLQRDILPLLWPPASKAGKAAAIDVSHPLLALFRIRSMVVESPVFQKGQAAQEKVLVIKGTEWHPPNPKKKTGGKVTSSGSGMAAELQGFSPAPGAAGLVVDQNNNVVTYTPANVVQSKPSQDPNFMAFTPTPGV